ncbi:MAG: hypothetical protein ACHP84_14875 [Caulobacterales bacterium]
MTAILARERYLAARDFIEREARPLDRALLRQGLGEADGAAVIAELAPFQNLDGGFGHGLEPDLATPASSALATSIGLRLARRAGAGADHPMVRAALAWLAANLDGETGVWPIVPRAVEDAPHAPWWTWSEQLAENWNGFRFNPTAELLAALYVWRAAVDPKVLAKAEAAMRRAIAETPVIDGAYDLKCAVRLAETTQAPADLRAALTALVVRSVADHDPDDEHLPALERPPVRGAWWSRRWDRAWTPRPGGSSRPRTPTAAGRPSGIGVSWTRPPGRRPGATGAAG